MDKGGDGGTLTDGPKILAFCCLKGIVHNFFIFGQISYFE